MDERSPELSQESLSQTSASSEMPHLASEPLNRLRQAVRAAMTETGGNRNPEAIAALSDRDILKRLGVWLTGKLGGIWESGVDAIYSNDGQTLAVYVRRDIEIQGKAYTDRLREQFERMKPGALTIFIAPGDITRNVLLRLEMPVVEGIVLASELPAIHAENVAANQFSLSDHPITGSNDDQLGFDAYASAIANIIDNPETETPLTLAIHAPWGVGKSSLGRMIQERLTWAPATGRKAATSHPTAPHRVFWFNAWRHDEANNLVTAFLSELARDCFRRSPLLARAFLPLPASMRTKAMSYWARAVYFLSAILIAALLYWLSDLVGLVDLIGELFGMKAGADGDGGIKAKTVVGGSILTVIGPMLRWAMSFRSSIEQFVDDPKAAAAKGLIGDIRSQMAALIHRSPNGRLDPPLDAAGDTIGDLHR